MDEQGHTDLPARFERAFASLAAVGRDPDGGWSRLAWTPADEAARRWFRDQAGALGLRTSADRAGNLWAWWGDPDAGHAVATGSHLDTVLHGGAYDGALGVVAAFLAIEELRRRGVTPRRPVAVVGFADEEGARFNTPTFGSRVLTGALEPGAVLGRTDRDGVTMAEAVGAFGWDPAALGPDPEALGRVASFVELHVEQGRAMADGDTPVGLGRAVLPHGRWRLTVEGEANHAGTTALGDRRDATLVLAHAILEARRSAAAHGAVATVPRLSTRPNAATTVASRVTAWLDCRAPTADRLSRAVDAWWAAVERAAAAQGCRARLDQESLTDGVTFDAALARRLGERLRREGRRFAELDTAAGHDAGILAAAVPSAMLFVRNPTGVSHSPHEHATREDCVQGVLALADLLDELAR